MKRLKILKGCLILVLVVLLAVGCKTKENDEDTTPTAEQTEDADVSVVQTEVLLSSVSFATSESGGTRSLSLSDIVSAEDDWTASIASAKVTVLSSYGDVIAEDVDITEADDDLSRWFLDEEVWVVLNSYYTFQVKFYDDEGELVSLGEGGVYVESEHPTIIILVEPYGKSELPTMELRAGFLTEEGVFSLRIGFYLYEEEGRDLSFLFSISGCVDSPIEKTVDISGDDYVQLTFGFEPTSSDCVIKIATLDGKRFSSQTLSLEEFLLDVGTEGIVPIYADSVVNKILDGSELTLEVDPGVMNDSASVKIKMLTANNYSCKRSSYEEGTDEYLEERRQYFCDVEIEIDENDDGTYTVYIRNYFGDMDWYAPVLRIAYYAGGGVLFKHHTATRPLQ